MTERSSVVNTPGTRVRVEVPHPSEKYMKSFGEHGVRRSVREISHLCLKTHITMAKTLVAAADAQNAAENVVVTDTIVTTKINNVLFSTKENKENDYSYTVAVIKTSSPISAIRRVGEDNAKSEAFRFSMKLSHLMGQLSSIMEEEFAAISFANYAKEISKYNAMSEEDKALYDGVPEPSVPKELLKQLLMGSEISLSLEDKENEDGVEYTVKTIKSIKFGFIGNKIVELAKANFEDNLKLYLENEI